jgi:hypothetical protein
MWAMPLWMFFLSFLTFGFFAPSGAPDESAMAYAPVPSAFLRMAAPLRGPLRGRALVCVR